MMVSLHLLKQTHAPSTFVSATFQATLDQAQDPWPEYGGVAQGWGKRFGTTLADTEARRFIQTFALSTILHEDPRYFPSRKRSHISRSWYAATRVVITRNDRGDNTSNTSEFLGALFTCSLQNSYYPRQERNFGETMNRFTGALSSDAVGDLRESLWRIYVVDLCRASAEALSLPWSIRRPRRRRLLSLLKNAAGFFPSAFWVRTRQTPETMESR